MTAIDKFAAHVGLDWADKKHDVCVQFKNGERIFHVVEHTPEALDIWLNELHQKVKGRIAIALELKKGPVVYALQKYPFVTVFPVHSLSLARYRQTFWPSGAKDDPQDADFVIHYIDLWSHAVIGWSMSARMTAQLACDALKMALWRRKRPENVIVHTDRGSQYCSADYQALLKRHSRTVA